MPTQWKRTTTAVCDQHFRDREHLKEISVVLRSNGSRLARTWLNQARGFLHRRLSLIIATSGGPFWLEWLLHFTANVSRVCCIYVADNKN